MSGLVSIKGNKARFMDVVINVSRSKDRELSEFYRILKSAKGAINKGLNVT